MIAPTAPQSVNYTYNALNQRVEEQDVNDGTTTHTQFDYDPSGDLIMQYNSGGMTDIYLPDASGGVAPLAHEDTSGNVTWLLTDQNGSVQDIANANGTSLTYRALYDSFGQAEESSGTPSIFGYQGMMQSTTAPSGIFPLYYDNARWYDPATENFISQDPKGLGGGDTNLYRLVHNDPVNGMDPTGLEGPQADGSSAPGVNLTMPTDGFFGALAAGENSIASTQIANVVASTPAPQQPSNSAGPLPVLYVSQATLDASASATGPVDNYNPFASPPTNTNVYSLATVSNEQSPEEQQEFDQSIENPQAQPSSAAGSLGSMILKEANALQEAQDAEFMLEANSDAGGTFMSPDQSSTGALWSTLYDGVVSTVGGSVDERINEAMDFGNDELYLNSYGLLGSSHLNLSAVSQLQATGQTSVLSATGAAIPLFGSGYNAVTGTSLLTGQQLSGTDRAAAGFQTFGTALILASPLAESGGGGAGFPVTNVAENAPQFFYSETVPSASPLIYSETSPSLSPTIYSETAPGGMLSVHGNSILSQNSYTYGLYSETGSFLKWGVTQDTADRYSQSYMSDKLMYQVASGSRIDMLRLERDLVETQPGRLNHEPWAGSRRGE